MTFCRICNKNIDHSYDSHYCNDCHNLGHFQRQLLLSMFSLTDEITHLNENIKFLIEDKKIEKGEQVFDDHSVENEFVHK